MSVLLSIYRSAKLLDHHRLLSAGLLRAAPSKRPWHLLAQPRVGNTGISCMTKLGKCAQLNAFRAALASITSPDGAHKFERNRLRCRLVGEDCHVNRVKAVRQALDGRVKRVYLEIGVEYGSAFRRIAADEKIAVDPAFKLSRLSRRLADTKARATYYFEMTSDTFFADETAFLEQHGIDVALIDGLHTYKQVVRDVENTLRYLRDDGVIVLHDCNPARASIARPATSHADFRAQNHWWNRPIWTGDVWKAIVYLRSARHDLRVAVLKCDFGVGIVQKGVPKSRLSYSAAQIEALNYADLAADRERFLNLKPPTHLHEFLASQHADSSRGSE
jgi:methyltransferase family protein